MSLAKKAASSSILNVIFGILQTIIRLASTFYLARVLLPEDFGIVAYATLIYGFFSILTSIGVSQAIIVRKDITQNELSTAFWLNLVLYSLLSLILFFSSINLAHFFNELKIIKILNFFSFMFLFAGISSISSILLNKNMEFFKLNIIAFIGTICEVTLTIYLVIFNNLTYMAIIFGIIFAEIIMTILKIYFAKWKPSFTFDKSILNYFMKFSFNLSGERILIYIRHNIDYLIIGKFLSSRELGLYSFAYKIPNMIYDKIAIPASSVLLPYIMKNDTIDNSLLGSSYIKLTKYIALITFPILFGVISLAEPMILLFWGKNWASIILPLQILCFAPMIYVLSASIGSLFLAKERPDLLFKIEISKLLITFTLVSVLGYYFKLTGIAIGMSISALLTYNISFFIAFNLIDYKKKLFISEITPIFISSLISSIFAYLSFKFSIYQDLTLIISFFIGIIFGIIFYIGSIYTIFPSIYLDIIKIYKILLKKDREVQL